MRKLKLKLVKDFSVADWFKPGIVEAHNRKKYSLAMYIPACFESYVAVKHEGNSPIDGDEISIDYEFLYKILKKYTQTPKNCYMALWNGFGWDFQERYRYIFENQNNEVHGPKPREYDYFFELPDREYYLMQGKIHDSSKIYDVVFGRKYPEPVNILWPSDKKWFVATEIDFEVTLIGGSAQLVNAIVDSQRFDCHRFDINNFDPEMFLADWIDNANGKVRKKPGGELSGG